MINIVLQSLPSSIPEWMIYVIAGVGLLLAFLRMYPKIKEYLDHADDWGNSFGKGFGGGNR